MSPQQLHGRLALPNTDTHKCLIFRAKRKNYASQPALPYARRMFMGDLVLRPGRVRRHDSLSFGVSNNATPKNIIPTLLSSVHSKSWQKRIKVGQIGLDLLRHPGNTDALSKQLMPTLVHYNGRLLPLVRADCNLSFGKGEKIVRQINYNLQCWCGLCISCIGAAECHPTPGLNPFLVVSPVQHASPAF